MSDLSNKIEAHDRTIYEVLNAKKYSVDYFQREYNWGTRHIEQLITDLTTAFLNEYSPKHTRSDGTNYNSYYLGPFVISGKDGNRSIIDGQQRLTSITLFLIYLNSLQKSLGISEPLEPLMFSDLHGVKSFNIQDKDDGGTLQRHSCGISRRNKRGRLALLFRLAQVQRRLSRDNCLSDDNAYTIFETMNDRGLNLTPTEMLKGFVLSRFKDAAKRQKANTSWKQAIQNLHDYDKDEDQRFFQA